MIESLSIAIHVFVSRESLYLRINYNLRFFKFFLPLLANGFLLDYEWQQVFWSLQEVVSSWCNG